MHPELTPSTPPQTRLERGRAAVPVEQALAFQVALVEYMVGPQWEHLSADEREAAITEWFDKYVTKQLPDGQTFNAFAEYCDEYADDTSFIERVSTGQWTVADLESLKRYAEKSPKGEPFMSMH